MFARAISLTTTGGKLSEFRFEQIVGGYIHDALTGNKPPRAALNEAAAELRGILGQ